MNELEYLLTTLGEEGCEVGQRTSKAIRFGMNEVQPGQEEDNKRRIEREIADLIGVAKMLGLEIRDADVMAKIEKVKKFMEYSRQIGTLEPCQHRYNTIESNPKVCLGCGEDTSPLKSYGVSIPEYAKVFGNRKTVCVHCDIEVPGNVPCPKCGR